MFFGEFRHNIDAKGRLSIPAKMRNQCGECVYVTRGNDGCLALYTQQGWEKYYEELQALPQKKKSTRIFIRLVTSRASECEFDKLGRINIPLVLTTNYLFYIIIERCARKNTNFLQKNHLLCELFPIYLSGTNLLTFSKFKLWDVEMGGNGLGYPIQRVYNVGVQLDF